MLRQIKLLTGIRLKNLFGINTFRFSKDKKKKVRYAGMALVWFLLIAIFVTYAVVMSIAYIQMGMAEIVPLCFFTITSFIILFFSVFEAGSVIFQRNTYEMLITFPVSKAAIVISRFMTMYIMNLLLSIVVVLPGMIVYGVMLRPAIHYYIYGVLGLLLLPLLPLSMATAVGAAITAISSRMKHKSLVSAILLVAFAMCMMVGSIGIGNIGMEGDAPKLDMTALQNLSGLLKSAIEQTYPPAAWYGNAVLKGSLRGFLYYAILSFGVFGVLVAVLQKYFQTICIALNATTAKNNFKMQQLATSSVLKSLWKKELKRYFASSIYVSNTVVGYLLMSVTGVALLVMGPEQIEAALQMPGVVVKAFPLVLAAVAVIMPSTCCAISMEGKQWWIAQTLPVRSKDIWNSKMLVHMTIALPFYLVAVITGMLALRPAITECLWLALIPFLYLVFSSVVGITVNLKFPVFDWENDVKIVKQSASCMVTMLIDLLSVAPAFALVLFLGESYKDMVYGVTVLIVSGVTIGLYVYNNKKSVQI